MKTIQQLKKQDRLEWAFSVATREWDYPPTTAQRDEWHQAECVLIGAGLCPHCACDGERSKLGRWEPGNQFEYAGRRCLMCEEFVVCGEQPCYADGPEVDASGQCYSDALPGF